MLVPQLVLAYTFTIPEVNADPIDTTIVLVVDEPVTPEGNIQV